MQFQVIPSPVHDNIQRGNSFSKGVVSSASRGWASVQWWNKKEDRRMGARCMHTIPTDKVVRHGAAERGWCTKAAPLRDTIFVHHPHKQAAPTRGLCAGAVAINRSPNARNLLRVPRSGSPCRRRPRPAADPPAPSPSRCTGACRARRGPLRPGSRRHQGSRGCPGPPGATV